MPTAKPLDRLTKHLVASIVKQDFGADWLKLLPPIDKLAACMVFNMVRYGLEGVYKPTVDKCVCQSWFVGDGGATWFCVRFVKHRTVISYNTKTKLYYWRKE